MANKNTIELTITAKDQAGKVLISVNKEVALTGKTTKQAAKEVEQSSSSWARFTKTLQANRAEILAGGRALVRLTSEVGKAGDDTEQALFGIRAAYKETSADWIAWSKDMQEATTFSDEAFMRSAQNMKTLVTNYALTEGQVQELIAASADLAAVNRLDVYDAVTRVQSAIRGEAEASEYLGLTLNDTYMKNQAFGGSLRDVWETLDDNTKAQYRYREVLQQSAYAQGKAAAATKTAEGQYRKLQNAIQDQVAQVGQAINKSGPWLKMLEDGMGLVDQISPLYSALTLKRIADTAALGTHTAAQVADNAAMVGGTGAVQGLTGALGGGGGLSATAGAATLASGGLVVVLGEVALALGAVAAGAWATNEAVTAVRQATWEESEATEIYEHHLRLAKEALDEGRISTKEYIRIAREAGGIFENDADLIKIYNDRLTELRYAHRDGEMTASEYNAAVAQLAQIMGVDLNTAYQDTGIAGDSYTESLKRGKLGTDDLRMSTDNLITSLKEAQGLQGPGYSPPPSMPKEGPTDVDVRKRAYQELLKLPQQRAQAEKEWDAIIAQAAQASGDQRIQSALRAMDRENEAHKANVAKLKADQAEYNTFVESEEKRIADLRAAGQWQAAGEAEMALKHIQEWHRQNDITVEDLEREHNERMKGLLGEYESAVKNTTDNNLRMQLERKENALKFFDEEEARIKEVMATGKEEAKGWQSSWKTANEEMRKSGITQFDKWYEHVKKKLDQPVVLTITSVYVPGVSTTTTSAAGTAENYGGAGGVVAQHGLIVPGPPTREVPAVLHGGEMVYNPNQPNPQVAAALAQVLPGLGGVTVTGNQFIVRTDQDIPAIAAEIMRQAGGQSRNIARAGVRVGGY